MVMRLAFSVAAAAWLSMAARTAAAASVSVSVEEAVAAAVGRFPFGSAAMPIAGANNSSFYADLRLKMNRGPSLEEMEEERSARFERNKERRQRWKERLKDYKPDPSSLKKVTKEEMEKYSKNEQAQSWIRRLWGGGGSGGDSSESTVDPGEEYDKWAQAYRMLGAFIDCDHQTSEGSGDSGDNGNDDGDDGGGACSRWTMWAAYVNPNYQGNEYYEYFGDNPSSYLDCHSPDTEWELLGIYRQELYQFYEQISKHLWALADYEYIVALAGLAYMTDYDCFYVGADNSGNSIYAGVAPQPYGQIELALYTDGYCITPDTSTGTTFDDYGLTSSMNLGSGDSGDDGNYDDSVSDEMMEWWYDSQEYTLTLFNEVYDDYTYCTSCVDYPTYQDGYFIGDDGTDDDDLINQCWKFWSHDSYVCEADCIAKGHAQGTILSVHYGGITWGETPSGFYTEGNKSTGSTRAESRWSRLLANIFVTFAFVVFVATFLAFAVARRSRHRESRNRTSKSRRLLDDDHHGGERRRSRHKRREGDGDGIFRSNSKSRGKSDRSHKSRSRSKKKHRSSAEVSGEEGYAPPSGSERDRHSSPEKGESRRSKSSSRRKERRVDDF